MEHSLSEGGFGEWLAGNFETPDSGHESPDLGLSTTPFISESSKSLAIKSDQFDQHVIVLNGIAMLLDRFSELREIRLGVSFLFLAAISGWFPFGSLGDGPLAFVAHGLELLDWSRHKASRWVACTSWF
jgi:hypothetical protein